MSFPEVVSDRAIIDPALALIQEAQSSLVLADILAGRHKTRQMFAEDLRRLTIYAPQLPDAEVHKVYERVEEAEARVVGAGRLHADYGEGTAEEDDDLLVVTHPGSVLLEAQHATDPVRKRTGRREDADHGTGGLAIALAEDMGGLAIVMRGRQTGNANVDETHRLKDELKRAADSGAYHTFFAVHGCYPGKVVGLWDPTEIHAVIGLGKEPTEEDMSRAERVARLAMSEYGLRVVIGNVRPHLNFARDPAWGGSSFWDRSTTLATGDDGKVKAERLASLTAGSTVTFMRTQTGLPSAQMELSRSLRLMPSDRYRRPDPSAEAYGVYLGYQLCRLAIETR